MSDALYIVVAFILYGLLLVGVVWFARRFTRLFLILIGVSAIVAALPVAYLSEIAINGCCGAPSTGREGMGYAFGVLLGVAGIASIYFSRKVPAQRNKK